ncbi:MAG TPA: alkaline phosphatase family protein, partial [Solirubrobacteraceae bacterium]|nr:alkaline phosphatase family protein [Solirubrobacteraceae bacterium]
AGTMAGPRADATLADARPVVVVRTPAPAPAPVAAPNAAPSRKAPAPVRHVAAPAARPAPAPAAQPVATAPAAPAPKPKSSDTPVAPPAPTHPDVKHVWVVALADHGFDEALDPASATPYLKGLPAKGLMVPNYYAVAHGSLANGIALLSGQGPNPDTIADCASYTDFAASAKKPGADGQLLGHGCVYPASTKSLPGQLTDAGRTWKAYVEDMGNVPQGQQASCRHPDPGAADPFAAPRPGDASLTRRDPFVFFHAIVDTPDCAAGVVGLDRLAPDLADAQSTPSFSYIVPNACHDGRDAPCADGAPAGLAAADTWLQGVLEPILASKAYADGGLVIVTFDQAATDGPHADARASSALPPAYPNAPGTKPGGGRVGALLLSKFVKAGKVDDTEYDHFALLRSIEDLFSLDPLGYAGRKGETGFGEDVWGKSPAGD